MEVSDGEKREREGRAGEVGGGEGAAQWVE